MAKHSKMFIFIKIGQVVTFKDFHLCKMELMKVLLNGAAPLFIKTKYKPGYGRPLQVTASPFSTAQLGSEYPEL